MNSHQRRKARREEERFIATPEGAQLVRTLDEFSEYVAEYRRQRSSTGICFFCGVRMMAIHDVDCLQKGAPC